MYYQIMLSVSLVILEIKDCYKPLKSRPSCDLLLPDDWLYMPILEAYFHHARPPTEKDQTKVYFKIDPEVNSYLNNISSLKIIISKLFVS